MGQIVDFSASTTKGCAPFSINFSDLSNPTPTGWAWDFGNGNTSSVQNPSTIYQNPGSYDVKLTATYASGNIQVVKYNYIVIFSKPVPNFASNLQTGCQTFFPQFTDQSIRGNAPINYWLWDFGNGITAGQQNPQAAFSQPGNFTITLLVNDTNNCSATVSKNAYITVLPKPTAYFSSSNNNACSAPHTASFVNASTANTPGTLYSNWDFGNGQTSSTNGSQQSLYSNPGIYNVRLVVTNALGCRDTMAQTGFVNVQNLKASFTNTIDSGCPPLYVAFTNTSTPSFPGNRFSWDFGNGKISSQRDTGILFQTSGLYTVKMKFTIPNGCSDSVIKTNKIKVFPEPVANFTADDSAACKAPLEVRFQNLTPNASSFLWTFGDGTSSTQRDPVKIYNSPGRYDVKLIVFSPNGCNDTLERKEMIKIVRPQAQLYMDYKEGCTPLTVNFSNASKSVSPIVSIRWEFKPGATSTFGFPLYTYVDTGKYFPKLVIVTDDGCTDTANWDTVRVGMKPTADFFGDSLVGCKGSLKVKFTNLSNNGTGIKADRWFWTFGTGGQSKEKNPTFVYDNPSKKYDVQLVAYNNGCPDTMQRKDYIHVLEPTAQFTPSVNGCNSDSFFFANNSIGGNKWLWKYGDGLSATDSNGFHIYGSGVYNVQLIATDTNTGCVDSTENYISVTSKILPVFSSDSVVCVQTGVWFLDRSPANTSGWEWDFGTGTTYTNRNVYVSFDKPGYYTVRLSAIIQGCRRTLIKQNYLHVVGPGMDIVTNPKNICSPAEVKLLRSVQSYYPVTSMKWTIFKSYTDSVVLSALLDTVPYSFPDMTYPQTTGYLVKISGTDSVGCKSSYTDTFRFFKPNLVTTIQQIPSCAGSAYLFEGENADTTNPKPWRFDWDFVDGTAANTDSTVFTFFNNGNKRVRAILTDAYGCTDTTITNISVRIKDLKAVIGAAATYAKCPPFIASFYDSSANSTAGINKWEWSFGDGSFSQVKNPSKIFLLPGKYDVALKVTDTFGCVDSVFRKDYIHLGGTNINYTFSKKQGCDPLQMEVQSFSSGNVDVKWDMNDGNIIDSQSFTYTYTTPGSFIPLAFIKDSTGCQYIRAATDTIVVFAAPTAKFISSVSCSGIVTQFTNQTAQLGSNSYTWLYGDGGSDTGQQAAHLYGAPGRYFASLIASNARGCSDTATKEIMVSFVKASISSDTQSCEGYTVNLAMTNKGIGKNDWVQWKFGDGQEISDTFSRVSHAYAVKGIYTPVVIVQNEYGCKDTAKGHAIKIGSSSAPPPPQIYAVSVNDNMENSLSFRPFTDFDFEKYIIYRQSSSGTYDSIWQFTRATDTVYKEPVPNRNQVYCYKVQTANFCGHHSALNILPAHCNMDVAAYPANDASLITWTPYVGWPVKNYRISRTETPGSYSFLKEVGGNDTVAYDSAIVCNRTYLYRIEAVEAGGNAMRSQSDTAGTKPNYIPIVPVNELVSASVAGPKENEITWSATLNNKATIVNYVLERSEDGTDYKLARPPFDGNTLHVYDNSVYTDRRSYYYRVYAIDSCGFSSNYSNIGKTILLQAKADTSELPLLNWSAYEYWQEGIDYYAVDRLENDVFVPVTQVSGTTLSFVDNISPLNGLGSYCYRITAYRNNGSNPLVISTSNIACAPLLPRLFVPNAFTPNEDGINPVFEVKGMYVSRYNIRIFSHWGEQVFEGNAIDQSWDGNYKGKPAPDGIYIYTIGYYGADNEFYEKKGNITLIR